MTRKWVAAFAIVLSSFTVTSSAWAAGDTFAQHRHKDKSGRNAGGGNGGARNVPVDEEADLPLKWLFVGLGVSAVIGAAGGEVLVNLVRPKS